MELKTTDGRLKLGSVFKLVATGDLLGAGVIFIPGFALIALGGLATGVPVKWGGQVVEGAAATFLTLMPLVMIPFVLAMQAMMFGGLIVLGLALYQTRRPLRVVADEAAEVR